MLSPQSLSLHFKLFSLIRDSLQQDCLHVTECITNVLLFCSIFNLKYSMFLPISTFAQSARDIEREDVSNVCLH